MPNFFFLGGGLLKQNFTLHLVLHEDDKYYKK